MRKVLIGLSMLLAFSFSVSVALGYNGQRNNDSLGSNLENTKHEIKNDVNSTVDGTTTSVSDSMQTVVSDTTKGVSDGITSTVDDATTAVNKKTKSLLRGIFGTKE